MCDGVVLGVIWLREAMVVSNVERGLDVVEMLNVMCIIAEEPLRLRSRTGMDGRDY